VQEVQGLPLMAHALNLKKLAKNALIAMNAVGQQLVGTEIPILE